MSTSDDWAICPCCRNLLSLRQIERHLNEVYDAISLDSDSDLGSDLDSDSNLNVNSPKNNLDIEMVPFSEAMDQDELPPVPHATWQNPPVTVEVWDEPESDGPDSNDEWSDLGDDPDCDPEYVERDEPPRLDPDDEPRLTDNEMRELLEFDFGDMLDDEWVDMYSRAVSERDLKTLKFLATRLRTHFSRATWDDLRFGACEELDLPSEFIAWRRLRILSGLETRNYDCCFNSCCCFVGQYKDLVTCPFCKAPRYNARGKPRRTFLYTPLIPQLRGLFQSASMAKKLRYRAKAEGEYTAGDIYDVFDGDNYRRLRETRVDPNRDYCFFDNPEDVALGLSTDGFTLFKRRKRGHSTAWPILLINYNLDPSIRNHLENVICVGVIPGPKQAKDINSFFVPLVNELLELEAGVAMGGLSPSPEGVGYDFVLHAFIIIIIGDIPAISKLMMMKGHNAFSPCRVCYIEGVLCRLKRTSVYYVPLMAPNNTSVWLPDQLPMRTHQKFLEHYAKLRDLPTRAAHNEFGRDLGINGEPIFTRLRSIDFPSSFPYDIMHLLFENLVPNMIKHWVGDFKGLDAGKGTYQISKANWIIVGILTARATRTIPSVFVGTLPDIAEDRVLYKAEAYSFWIQYLAPILLKGFLSKKYYDHLIQLREIIILCLQFKITNTEIDELQLMINSWVIKYEEYYYQYRSTRLPACPLTVHALLHIPYSIRRTGPLWASWAFVMERFCGHLLPAVKNRTRPYEHLDHYVERRAQMQVVSRVHNLPSLAHPRIKYQYVGGIQTSSHEVAYKEFENVVLGRPVKRMQPDKELISLMVRYFGVVYPGRSSRELCGAIDPNTLVRYGRFRIASDGDSFRTAILIDRDPLARDNSYVKYDLLPDRNTRFRNRLDDPVREVQYGRLLDIYYVEFIESQEKRVPYLLARVEECDTGGKDAARRGTNLVTYRRVFAPILVHIETIYAVVGRVSLGGNEWAIVDRSRDGVRTQFLDEAGNIDLNL